jgi:hypothetical protein
MGFFDGGVVATDACLTVEGADDYLFGILTSRMHMDWLRVVGGRLKSDYRYSKDLVYNNFVFPDATEEQRSKLAELARGILAARASEPDGTLADLYDPTNMPAPLRRAHRLVDEYVDKLYRQESFANEEDRAVYLLALNADAASRT